MRRKGWSNEEGYHTSDCRRRCSPIKYPLITGILTVLLFILILSGTRVKKPTLDICTAIVNILAFIYAVRTAYEQYESAPVLYIVPALLLLIFGLFLLKKAASG